MNFILIKNTLINLDKFSEIYQDYNYQSNISSIVFSKGVNENGSVRISFDSYQEALKAWDMLLTQLSPEAKTMVKEKEHDNT